MFAKMLLRSAPVLAKIYRHPFNQKLFDGTLSGKLFEEYLRQDKLYLKDFSRVLLNISFRLPNNTQAEKFKKLSSYIGETELDFHQKYLGSSKANTFFERNSSVIRIPAIEDYTQHLFTTSTYGSIQEAVAAVVPCFYIYSQLGRRMNIEKLGIDHPYRNLISSYSSEEFITATQSIIKISGELSHGVSPEEEDKICLSFKQSVVCELEFFNALSRSDVLTPRYQLTM